MNTIGIICAMDSEFAKIRDALSGGKEVPVGKQIFYTGAYGGKQVVAATCGIGKVNAAACAQTLCSRFGVDCILNSGVAGALSPKLRILDLVVASEVMEHDLDEHLLNDYFPGCSRFPADAGIARLVTDVCRENGFSCLSGRIVSGDAFITQSDVKADILRRTEGDAVEMEGAAIGHVCWLNSLPFSVIRCISDGADDSGAMDYDAFVTKAAERCALLTLRLIERL